MGRGAHWQVGTILREPVEVTLHFVAWYLDQGADHITLLFDNPRDPAIAMLRDFPRVSCFPCTDAFWSMLNMADEQRFPKRQNAAMTWLYHQHTDGWFLNVDADEYLLCTDGGIAQMLADQPAEAISVRVVTAEALSQSVPQALAAFRTPMNKETVRAVYGADAPLFRPRRMGLIGHPQGKSLTRCGNRDLRLRQHWPERRRAGRQPEVLLEPSSGCHLLHVIGSDYEIWRHKLEWRTGASGFAPGLADRLRTAMAAAEPEAQLRDLHQRLHCADAALLGRLRDVGALIEVDLGLDEKVQRHLGPIVANAR